MTKPIKACGKKSGEDSLGETLAGKTGRQFWRSLEELSAAPEFLEKLHREFPRQASVWEDGFSRRRFLQLSAASLALAGVGACTRQPSEEIVPYVDQPERLVPGLPLYFATALTHGGYAQGVVVESNMGRPTKIDGNPDHPASRGGSTAVLQARILELYDPDRSQTVLERGSPRSWNDFDGAMSAEWTRRQATRGKGLHLLTGRVTSPTLLAQISEWQKMFPLARWHWWESDAWNNPRLGCGMFFGTDVEPRFDLSKVRIIVALDSDFLTQGPSSLALARDFADGRRMRGGQIAMNRLYALETMPTATGASADHRVAVRPSELFLFAAALARRLGVEVPAAPQPLGEKLQTWVEAIAADLESRPGETLIVAGDEQPPAMHALAAAINRQLGNAGKGVEYPPPVAGAAPADPAASLGELVAALRGGDVDTLLICDCNAVHTAPVDDDFASLMENVRLRVHLGLHCDETGVRCHWHLPQAHELETWSDARAAEGTATIMQPLIAPLYGGRSTHEFMETMLGRPGRSSHDVIRAAWRGRWGNPAGEAFEQRWRESLRNGVVAENGVGLTAPTPRGEDVRQIAQALFAGGGEAASATSGQNLELNIRPDPLLGDGRYANLGWLQECPRPLTKLTWGNALMLSPATAARLGLRAGDHVLLEAAGRKIEAPVWPLPGHAAQCLTLHLGYGRARAGRVGNGVGVDANLLRGRANPWRVANVKIAATGGRTELACTQDHSAMEGREPARRMSMDDFLKEGAGKTARGTEKHASLLPDYKYDGYKWAMSIDLTTCIGCNACIVACQAENNIPVVGKEEVLRGREMHWIRIDRYFETGEESEKEKHEENELEAARPIFQPVMCVHCEKAPCEYVCPVGATLHDGEGLNVMVYNRCVGTRYCSNNCPYKVRRFNFLQYTDKKTESLKMQRNPEVTVRNRGVMEKCTYCLQRISRARIDAEKKRETIARDAVKTACQAACPTRAIVLGDWNDAQSAVTNLKAQPHDYDLLGELDTRPRTSYLARIDNPNPALGAELPPERKA